MAPGALVEADGEVESKCPATTTILLVLPRMMHTTFFAGVPRTLKTCSSLSRPEDAHQRFALIPSTHLAWKRMFQKKTCRLKVHVKKGSQHGTRPISAIEHVIRAGEPLCISRTHLVAKISEVVSSLGVAGGAGCSRFDSRGSTCCSGYMVAWRRRRRRHPKTMCVSAWVLYADGIMCRREDRETEREEGRRIRDTRKRREETRDGREGGLVVQDNGTRRVSTLGTHR